MLNPKPGLTLENYFPMSIKTKRFLKPYLESFYGNPICFSFKHTLGTVIAGLLERPQRIHKTRDDIQFRFDKFDTELIIYLPKTFLTKYEAGYALSVEGVITFNKHFENAFEEDLYKCCELARIYKIQRKKAIEEFCMRHHVSIEEDITYECLQKKEYRFHTEQINLKNSPAQSSSHFRKII